MVTGVWLKKIINRKKIIKAASSKNSQKNSSSEKSNGYRKVLSTSGGPGSASSIDGNNVQIGISIENAAATRIQTAYRAYVAKKTYSCMRGMIRLKNLVQRDSVKKQASAALSHLHSWSRIQAHIRERRVHMVTESCIMKKRIENQLKLEAKLHELEVDWSGGGETMDEALARIHERKDAAVRRERAMAYAFSHQVCQNKISSLSGRNDEKNNHKNHVLQWRACSNPKFGSGNYGISKESWGWSWKDRWIAARPWESRVPISPSSKKAQNHQASKTPKSLSTTPKSKVSDKNKLASPNGNSARRSRRLSYEAAEKTNVVKTKKPGVGKPKNEHKGNLHLTNLE